VSPAIRTTFRIVPCSEWGARPPKRTPTTVEQALRVIFHHTAGHHPEISIPASESREEAYAYARAIQHQHMAPGGLGAPNGGIDSGHNWLVCRNGLILEGRHGTANTISFGRMVASAHCVGQNDQIGVEHEHAGVEDPTPIQLRASGWLMAWIARRYGRRHPLPMFPHHHYNSTACPGSLEGYMGAVHAYAEGYLGQP